MTAPSPRLFVANWKMYGTQAMPATFMAAFRTAIAPVLAASKTDTAVAAFCPPFPYLLPLATAMAGLPPATGADGKSLWAMGAQDCAAVAGEGAATGEVSATMIKDCGCRFVIIGHSERRKNQGETDAIVAAKAATARTAGLVPIICIGETGEEADAGVTEAVLKTQIAALAPLAAQPQPIVIAYEPVWAIGTGKVPTLEDIAGRHRFIRHQLKAQNLMGPILYGGSVKAKNAGDILKVPDVSGVLVGGASLDPVEFTGIIQAGL